MKNWVLSQTQQGVTIDTDRYHLNLVPVTETIIRCRFGKEPIQEIPSDLLEQRESTASFRVEEAEEQITVSTERTAAVVRLKDGKITWKNLENGEILLQEGKKELEKIPVKKYTTGGEAPVINRVKTVDGERNFIQNLKEIVDHEGYKARFFFEFGQDEGIYGFGQAEEGVYNYRRHTQYLYQHNMRIPMPMFVSDQGYGMFFNHGCLMTFHEDENGASLFLDTIPQLDYFFVPGKNMDEIIRGFRFLTGDAAMLPQWAFGYIQSKEQYYTADELADIIREYRRRQVPIDCVVQDWNTWEPGNWGEKCLDQSRYGNLREKMDEINQMHAHAMVSVWPNMNSGGKNHTEFLNAGFLLNDIATYDAFSEEARKMYFEQAKKELFAGGFESWWCDSTEPFSGPDWGGEMKREPWERFYLVGSEHKKYLEPEQANCFALMHARGIFENQRKETEKIRVLNLTRSGYASGQKYGAMLWSGDTFASWKTLKQQITEGLNMGLSGYPFWTLDIGGFFTICENWQKRGCGCHEDSTPKWFWQGDYEDGVNDRAYRELYVRWLQMGTFLPMFRSHGTDTPREIWNFGEPGTMFYDAIRDFIDLRYRLMPYIYSLAGAVRLNQETMMRSLLFDFADDKKARPIHDQFLFGRNLLICPVTRPMYFEIGDREIHEDRQQECYLPKGTEWIDFWTGKRYEGGQTILADAPISQIPIFVRAGSILPMKRGLQYADQRNGEVLELHVYSGKDGYFNLYEDEGNNYNYESGVYAITQIEWNEEQRKLRICDTCGSYPGMAEEQEIAVYIDGTLRQQITYKKKEQQLLFPVL